MPVLYSRRIVGAELPKDGKPILIRNYRISDRGDGNYIVDLKGIRDPFVQISLPVGGGLSSDLTSLLRVDADTHVCTGVDPRQWEGLRTVHFYFRDLEKPILDLAREPWAKESYWGYMFGSAEEGEGRLRIPGVNCYVDPYVWSTGKDFFETALSTQGTDLPILSGPDINAAGRFVYPREPKKEWFESELKRFLRNGERVSREQLLGKLRQLTAGLDDYVIRSREILAWPILKA